MRVLVLVIALLLGRQRGDDAGERPLMRHAIGVANPEASLATTPPERQVGRADTRLGERASHQTSRVGDGATNAILGMSEYSRSIS